MLALVDANVWLPVLVERHQHHAAATDWWRDRQPATCCWCRPIQQTVLRLLTHRSVMGEVPGGNFGAKFSSGQAGTTWRGTGRPAHGCPQR